MLSLFPGKRVQQQKVDTAPPVEGQVEKPLNERGLRVEIFLKMKLTLTRPWQKEVYPARSDSDVA